MATKPSRNRGSNASVIIEQNDTAVANRPSARRFEVRHGVAAFAGGVILVLLYLSLSHLAEGLQALTEDSRSRSIALAVGIDLGVIVAELSLAVAKLKRIAGVRGMASAILVLSLLLSAILNAMSLMGSKELWAFDWWLAVVLGAFISFMVFGLAKIGTAFVVGKAEDERVHTVAETRRAERLARDWRRRAQKETAGGSAAN